MLRAGDAEKTHDIRKTEREELIAAYSALGAQPFLSAFRGLWETSRLWKTGDAGVIFLSGPIGAGKTRSGEGLLPLLAAPLFYIEGDTFWSFINKRGDCGFAFRRPVNRMGQRSRASRQWYQHLRKPVLEPLW